MTILMIKTLLRAGSVFASIFILKFSLDGFKAYEEIWIKIIFVLLVILGIPLIFILTNIIANLIVFRNKKEKQ